MNDDLTERAYAPRRSLTTLAALIVVLKNMERTEQNPLTGDYPTYRPRDTEMIRNNEREFK